MLFSIRNYILSGFLLISIFGYSAFSQNENTRKNDGKLFSASDASAIGEGKIAGIENVEANNDKVEKNTDKKPNSEKRNKFITSVLELATSLEGVPYLYAGKSPKGFDCSGFVYYVFKNHDIALPASSKMYDKVGKTISLENAQKGDILCFTGTDLNSEHTGHVGIIVENNPNEPIKFIHASSGKKHSIVYSLLSKDGQGYYAERFRSVRRVSPKS